MSTPFSNTEVAAYIDNLEEPRKSICAHLRKLIEHAWPELDEDYAWSRPVYKMDGKHVCSIVANKADVNLGFEMGARLNDPRQVLKGTGANMRHAKFRQLSDIDDEYCKALLASAKAVHAESRQPSS